jgi:hypothetical protein
VFLERVAQRRRRNAHQSNSLNSAAFYPIVLERKGKQIHARGAQVPIIDYDKGIIGIHEEEGNLIESMQRVLRTE